MAMLGALSPRAVLHHRHRRPGWNAHRPNEFLHLPMAKRLTA
jgi:hypothetical protein